MWSETLGSLEGRRGGYKGGGLVLGVSGGQQVRGKEVRESIRQVVEYCRDR